MLKDFYCKSRMMTIDGETLIVLEMLSASKLDSEESLFKLTMKPIVKQRVPLHLMSISLSSYGGLCRH